MCAIKGCYTAATKTQRHENGKHFNTYFVHIEKVHLWLFFRTNSSVKIGIKKVLKCAEELVFLFCFKQGVGVVESRNQRSCKLGERLTFMFNLYHVFIWEHWDEADLTQCFVDFFCLNLISYAFVSPWEHPNNFHFITTNNFSFIVSFWMSHLQSSSREEYQCPRLLGSNLFAICSAINHETTKVCAHTSFNLPTLFKLHLTEHLGFESQLILWPWRQKKKKINETSLQYTRVLQMLFYSILFQHGKLMFMLYCICMSFSEKIMH